MHERLVERYLAFTFDLVARAPFEHLHWGLWRGVPHEPHRLPEAQARYAEVIAAHVPRGRILDVGAGLGGIAAMLAARGDRVTALTPHRGHAARLGPVAPPGLSVLPTRFEDFVAADHDALLFAESFAFFVEEPRDVGPWLARCRELAPGGRIVLADLVAPAVGEALSREHVVAHEDWTEEVAFTVTALEERFAAARAYGDLVLSVLDELEPDLATRVRERLATVPNEALRALFEGRLVERSALAERPYQLWVIAV